MSFPSFLSYYEDFKQVLTQNPYSPNSMHYLQLSFLDASVKLLG
ncbi:hypothetical protein OZD61_02755 [Wolbachia endosymbiont of Drosophila bocki]|nr:hypothetical protein [Wolbachia endosymbiont of Drosophila bocki]